MQYFVCLIVIFNVEQNELIVSEMFLHIDIGISVKAVGQAGCCTI